MPTFADIRRKKFQAKIRKRKDKAALDGVRPTISQGTRDRLLAEAMTTGLFQLMEPEDVQAFVNGQIEAFLSKQPWWYGRTESADGQHRANQRRYLIEHGLIEANAQPAHLAKRHMTIDELIKEDEAHNIQPIEQHRTKESSL